MIYKEEYQDIFTLPTTNYAECWMVEEGRNINQGYCFAHCVSADFAMGKGIATGFVKKFNAKEETLRRYPKNNWNGHGYCAPLTPSVPVYNLVTKEFYYNKPTLTTMREALTELKQFVVEDKTSKIAMPLIGCGLDRLNWVDVSAMIKEIFANTEVEILICKV